MMRRKSTGSPDMRRENSCSTPTSAAGAGRGGCPSISRNSASSRSSVAPGRSVTWPLPPKTVSGPATARVEAAGPPAGAGLRQRRRRRLHGGRDGRGRGLVVLGVLGLHLGDLGALGLALGPVLLAGLRVLVDRVGRRQAGDVVRDGGHRGQRIALLAHGILPPRVRPPGRPTRQSMSPVSTQNPR